MGSLGSLAFPARVSLALPASPSLSAPAPVQHLLTTILGLQCHLSPSNPPSKLRSE